MTPEKEPAAGGGTGEGAEGQLKKGPWTKAEDAILKDYVKTHGKGNWNSVQRNTGLQRCGKSCRLRWANHLRPDLKKGPLSRDEEMLIIRLHAEHGNKWARIASHPELSGRTDNEIKNYWNTRKKRQPRGCYALEIQQQMAQRGNKQVPAAPAKSNLAPAPATPDLMEGNPYFSTSVAVEQSHFPLFNSSAQLFSPNPFGPLHQNPSRGRISFQSELSSFPPPASYLFHNFPSVPQYGLGSFEPSPPPPSYSVKMELPSSQLFSVSSEGNTGLCDPLLQSPYGIGDPAKDDLPLASVPFAPYSSPTPHDAYWAMEPLCSLGGSDFSVGIQVKKAMAEKMNQDVFTLPSLIPVQTMAPAVPQADWGLFDWHDPSDPCSEFSNNPSSAVTDDDTGVEMPDLQRDSYE